MARRKVNYREGDWVAVPLRDGGYAIGMLARVSVSGILFGYFFGPKLRHVPEERDIQGKVYSDAILYVRFGDLGITKGEWPVIFRPNDWKRDEWPMPDFVSTDLLRPKATKIRYDEDDLQTVTDRTPWPVEMVDLLPKDGLFGYGAVELRLTRFLDEEHNSE